MRIRVPLTGELIGKGKGNPNNPVRPINMVEAILKRGYSRNLTNFGWLLVGIDYDTGFADIEITFEKDMLADRDTDGNIIRSTIREENDQEFEARKRATEIALGVVVNESTTDALFADTGEPRLKK